jgi:hypothetical protein
MKMRTLLATLLLIPALAFADTATLKVGDPVPVLQLNDQFDKPFSVPVDTRLIVFTADKSASEMINGMLKQNPADFMTQRKMVYIADISGMPSFITNMVALPKMRDYAYRIAICMEKEQTAMLPRSVDSVTLIKTLSGKVVSIQQFKETDASQLSMALNQVASTDPASKP